VIGSRTAVLGQALCKFLFADRPGLVNPCAGADVTAIDGATQNTTSVGFWFAGFNPMNPFAVTVDPANHNFTCSRMSTGQVSGARPVNVGPSGRTSNCSMAHRCNKPRTSSTTAERGYMSVEPPAQSMSRHVARPDGNVAVWDSNWNLAATIPVGTNPVGVAVNETTNNIYVANSGNNNINVIDGTSNSVVATIADPNAVAPVAVAVNASTNTIYVANSQSNNLTVIDGAIGSVTATIPVGTSPSGVAVDSQTKFIYVANAGNSETGDPGNITVIDGATNATTTLRDSEGVSPSAVAVNSVTNKIYVANSGSNNVTVIDGAHD